MSKKPKYNIKSTLMVASKSTLSNDLLVFILLVGVFSIVVGTNR